jgi:hypothetical protein
MTTELSTHVGTGTVWNNVAKTIEADFGSIAGKVTQGNDSRLSDARTPTAHAASHLPGGSDALTTAAAGTITPGSSAATGTAASFARSDHTHTVPAFGTIAATFCQGNDSRLSDSRTPTAHASTHLPSGSDPLTTAAAVAITVDGANAVGSANSFARSDHAHVVLPKYSYFADQLQNPVTADWVVNSLAAAGADSVNSGFTVRGFVDASETGVGFICKTPIGATNIVFNFVSRAHSAPGSTLNVVPAIYVREVPDNAAVEAWSAATNLTALAFPNSTAFQYDTQTIALTTLSMVAGRVFQIELTRKGADAGDTLTQTWDLLLVEVGFT